jgi:hypothetical protein
VFSNEPNPKFFTLPNKDHFTLRLDVIDEQGTADFFVKTIRVVEDYGYNPGPLVEITDNPFKLRVENGVEVNLVLRKNKIPKFFKYKNFWVLFKNGGRLDLELTYNGKRYPIKRGAANLGEVPNDLDIYFRILSTVSTEATIDWWFGSE